VGHTKAATELLAARVPDTIPLEELPPSTLMRRYVIHAGLAALLPTALAAFDGFEGVVEQPVCI